MKEENKYQAVTPRDPPVPRSSRGMPGNRPWPDNGTGLLYSAFFISVLCIVGLVSMLTPSKTVSEIENRTLVPMPEFSLYSLFEGGYTDSLDLFYSDNFPVRDDLVTLASGIKDAAGYSTGVKIYQATGGAEADPVEDVKDTLRVVKADSLKKPAKKDTVKTPDYNKSSSIIVYNGRAIQLFSSTSEISRRYADMVNLYHQTFESLQIYCMIAPTPIDFYLPEEYKNSSSSEKSNIDFVKSLLDSTIVFADAYSELAKHTDRYIYFNTDHHWTGLGAYYAYRGFCRSAGLEPYELKQFEKKRLKKKFLGSLYGITLDKRLRDIKDSVEYYKLPIPTKTFRYNIDSGRFEKTNLFSNVSNYANFLGGDHPLVRIESEVNTEKLLIIKDSFGNAVAPYLALHFGTVYVMDYRYYDVNLTDFIKTNGITAIMFLHNTFAVNSKFASYRGRYFLSYKPTEEAKPEEDVKVQETDTVANHP
ncbi:MAG TPA: DHHW family protein [Cyclobacteriaceae bacterium]|nr:DHHW family protein [Cyclobacteriaceae bacterium]